MCQRQNIVIKQVGNSFLGHVNKKLRKYTKNWESMIKFADVCTILAAQVQLWTQYFYLLLCCQKLKKTGN